jgi:hypothetical protein
MIPFFRKIRKKMADDNKPVKYLRYATGEILLVVIGILIALQINTWNQERILNNEEETILKDINAEFLQNKEALNTAIINNMNCFEASKTIFQLFGNNILEIKKHNTDSLLYNVFETGEFIPSENTISDLLQSGRLQVLQNEKLKVYLYDWSKAMESYKTSLDRRSMKIDNELIPYLTKKYSLKDIDNYGILSWKNKSSLKHEKLLIFEDIEFENILDDYIYRLKSEESRLMNLEAIVDNILIATKQ